MGVAAFTEFRGRGGPRLFGSSGSDYIQHRAAATLSATYSISWPDGAPAGARFLQIDAAGDISYVTGASGTLDDAYDSGGAGGGRLVTADNGPVEIAGAGGLQLTHTDPALLFETTGSGDYNWRILATADDELSFQRGDQDADISDDTFDVLFELDGANFRIGLGTGAPGTFIHASAPSSTDCDVTLEAPAGQDVSLLFTEDSTARFQVGYDDSAGGFLVSGTAFGTLDALFIEDSTGDVGVGEVDPDAKLHVTGGASLVGLFEATTGTARLGLRDSASSDANQVGIQAVGDDLQLLCGGAVLFHMDAADARVGIGDTTPSGKLEVFSNVASQITLFVNQDHASGRGVVVDSEATSQPLIELLPLDSNTRGDITATGTARATDPSGPSNGDIWYNGAEHRWKARLNGSSATFANTLGPAFGAASSATISSGGATFPSGKTGVLVLVAEGGPGSDTLDTLAVTGSGEVSAGDVLILRAGSGDTITIGHATGNFLLNGSANKVLDNSDQMLVIWDGTNWRQLAGVMQLP